MSLLIIRSRELIEISNILDLEEKLNISLPDSYKKFLLSHNGGRPVPDRFSINNNKSDNYGIVDYFFCIKDKDIYNLFTWVKRFKNRIPADMIPIAIDPGGNLICLAIAGENLGKIYYWDHEDEGNIDTSPDYHNIYFIANTFDEFIEELINGREN